MKILRMSCVFGGFLSLVLSMSAQTFTTLYSFTNGADGALPVAPLVQGANGDLYGTASSGGNSEGTVFRITSGGALTPLYAFCCQEGAFPSAGMIQSTDGDFYGTTSLGGGDFSWCGYGSPCGTVFKITADSELTTLYSFCYESECPNGSGPQSGLVQATDRNFYGTTEYGGANYYCDYGLGCGTVFRVTASGKLTTLYSFCSQDGSNCVDGQSPVSGLIQGTDGDLYGTTVGALYGGPPTADGTVFKITLGGRFTTLHSFCPQSGCADGEWPEAGLAQASDGNFYGTTSGGGANNSCLNGGCGTVFKITADGTLTTLYSFCSQSGCTDGETPQER